MKEYNKSNVSKAKQLRKNMTPWERKLWYTFLNSYQIRFQRQKPIGEYIVDFYCAKAKLVIELDGSQHFDKKQIVQDNKRTKDLENMNLKVIRFSNYDIDKNFYEVCSQIDNIVKKTNEMISLLSTAKPPLPSSEGSKNLAPSDEGAVNFVD